MGTGRDASRSHSRPRRGSYDHHRRTASRSHSRSPRRPLKRPRHSRSRSKEHSRRADSRSRGRSRSFEHHRRSSRLEQEGGSRHKQQRSSSPRRRSSRSRSPLRHSRDGPDRDRGGRDGGRQHGRAADKDRDREARDRAGNQGRDKDRDRETEGDRDRGRGYTRDSERDKRQSRREEQQQQQQQPELHRQSSWDRSGRRAGVHAPYDSRPQGESDRGFKRPPVSDDPPEVGSIHPGVVQTVKPFGVFVAVQGYRKHVLVHHTQVSAEVVLTRSDDDELKVKALEYAAPAGQKVWVKVLEVSPDPTGNGFRVHGSMLVVDQNDGTDLDPTGQLAASRGPGGGGSGAGGRLSDEPPDVHSIHRGEVKRIEAYGVFVALQGYRRYGLVHASQVANYLEFSAEDSEADRKKALAEVVDVGQNVFVKVVEVTQDDRGLKIGCSMKLVDQADGTDLDPQNLRYRPRGEAGHGPASKAPVGASAGEVKGGTIDWGYLATRPDAFGSTGYDLLQDESEQQPGRAAAGAHGGYPHPPQQQQQQLPPVGRGRGAVVPAWMSQGPAAPGSAPNRESSGAAADMTVEEALRIIQAATVKDKKKHKEKHKKHKKSSKHKSHKSKKSKHSSKKSSRSRSRDGSSSSESMSR